MKSTFKFFGVIAIATMVGLMFAGCEGAMGPQDEQPGITPQDTLIVWLGEFAAHPIGDIAEGSAYFNSVSGHVYIFWGGEWRRMSQEAGQGQSGKDGISITWRGEYAYPNRPSDPMLNDVIHDPSSGNSYIYNGTAWVVLVAGGEIGPEGPKGNPGEVIPVTGIAISGATLATAYGYGLFLSTGGQAILTATVSPSNALVQTVLWVSDTPAVTVARAPPGARFSLATGSSVAVRVAEGTPAGMRATITATALGSEAEEVVATINVVVSDDLSVAEQIAGLRYMDPLPETLTVWAWSADDRIEPQTLAFDGNQVEITLTSGMPGGVLSLDRPGAMFAVGDGVTLVLDEIELRGMANNTGDALVTVNAGGTLIMEAGSRIAGNSNRSNNPATQGGGARVAAGGMFVMNGGEISGNDSPWGGGVFVDNAGTFEMRGGYISGNTANQGGGVVNWGTFDMHGGAAISGNDAVAGSHPATGGGVANLGTFNMRGGEISGNTAVAFGGGVANNQTFRMISGVIFGTDAGPGLANAAPADAGPVLANFAEAVSQRGTFSNGTFTSLGTLATTASTVRLADGVFATPPRQNFWAVNHNNQTYSLTAELLAYDDYSEIWVEIGSGVTLAQARAFADTYASMREKLLDAYSRGPFTASGRQFSNILDYANWLTRGDDGEGRLTILLLNLTAPPGLMIAGYFHSRDLFDVAHSNRRDMVYINSQFWTAPGHWPTRLDEAAGVLAHEIVHLINASETLLQGRGTWMDLWVDEALAEKSHYVVFGENNSGRVSWFVNDPAGTIAAGNNFFVWGNRRAQDTRAILDDYATAFLFARWLFLQAQAAPGVAHGRILQRMVTSAYHDYRIVTSVARDIDPAWANWDVLLKTWLAANSDPANPVFGYIGDDELRNTLRVRRIGNPSVSLFPGEGVFSVMNAPFNRPATSGPNIRHAGLTTGSGAISSGNTVTGNTLLTFNANTNRFGATETGFLTGVIPPAAMLAQPLPTPAGPLIVSLWDAIGRDGKTELLNMLPDDRGQGGR